MTHAKAGREKARWKGKVIAVIGDVMLDKYLFGSVERISPEAPVPIVTVERESYTPGGAANAASNVSTLGGEAVLIGIVGKDSAKDILLEEARDRGINVEGMIQDSGKPTIQKIRVLGQHQQLVRIDYEDTSYCGEEVAKSMLSSLSALEKIDAILISDYAKGAITRELMEGIHALAKRKGIPVVVDPKPKHQAWYKGCRIITPNKKEAEEMTGMRIVSEKDVEEAGRRLQGALGCDVLITLGEKGMALFERGKKGIHIPTVAKEVYDVSGAGDTVIATISLALASGESLEDAARLANQAAGIKVGKVGTAPVSWEELEAKERGAGKG